MLCCLNGKLAAPVALAAGVAFGLGLLAGKTEAPASAAPAQPEMSAEDAEAMMQEWAAMGQPGEHHERLNHFVGEYDVQAEFMMPGGETMESGGSLTSEWVLGGRFVHGDFRLDNMMGPFQGISFVGYDNQAGEYVSIWLDSMSTKAYVHKARFDGDVFVTEGEGSMGPMMIKSIPQDDGGMKDEFYDMGPDGEWVRSGTMVYTRK